MMEQISSSFENHIAKMIKIASLTIGLILICFVASATAQPSLKSEAEFGLSQILDYKGVAADLELSEAQADGVRGLSSVIELKLQQPFRNYQRRHTRRSSDHYYCCAVYDLCINTDDHGGQLPKSRTNILLGYPIHPT